MSIPDNFEVQSNKSNYTRLTPGQHRLRILSDAISGYEWWEDTPDGGRKPSRVKDNPPVAHADDIKKFLAWSVWNYEQEKIQILEITQATIQRELKSLEKDKDWGDLKEYDILIERTGNDKTSTKYRISPKPKSELSKDITKRIADGLPVLEALYKGEDPFTYNPNATESIDGENLPF